MSDRSEVVDLASDAATVTELVERAGGHDADLNVLARVLTEEVWNRDVPHIRVVRILEAEQERLEEYEEVSLSASSRAARYMDITDLELVSGYEFEHVLAKVLSLVEGEATVTEASGDQGLDVVWTRDDTTIGIQAKAYAAGNSVSNSAVQEIYTGTDVRGTEYTIDVPAVVTTSQYTNGAREAAENTGVVLYGRSDIQQWLSEAQLTAEEMGELLDSI